MQAVTAKWKSMFAGDHRVEFKAIINNTEYTYSEIKSASIRKAMMDKLTIGQATSATLDMVFMPNGTIPNSAEIKCYIRLTNYDPTVLIADELGNIIKTDDSYILAQSYSEESEWIPFGTFYIDTRETDAFGWMTVTAYDRMLAAEQEFPSSAGSMTMDSAVKYIANYIGVSVDGRNLIAPYSIDSPVGVYTMREVLCGIAAASGGNFIITENNKLRLVKLTSPSASDNIPVMTCNSLGNKVTIGKVTLYPDTDTQYSSGTSGYEIQADCIYATQTICDYVQRMLNGVTYLPYNAGTAFIDPTIEIGDSVAPNGVPSILASADFTVGVSMSANIEAPIDTEVNHEYPYQSRSKTERKLAVGQSKIEKTTEQIKLLVEDKMDEGEVQSVIDLSLNQLSISYTSGVNGASITLSKDGVEIEGDVKIGTIDASEIAVINIDADYITAGSLSADYIRLGGDMEVYESSDSKTVGGYIGYTTGDYGGEGIHMRSGFSEVVVTGDGAKMCQGGNQISVTSDGAHTNCRTDIGGDLIVSGSLTPSTDGGGSLGYSDYRWTVVYAKSSSIITSDREQKKDISYDLSQYDDLFYSLKPAAYRLKDGESGRIHTGFIAQDVESAMADVGLSGKDFAAFVKSSSGGSLGYGLRYEEFIALCVRQIQVLNEKIEKLERMIRDG